MSHLCVSMYHFSLRLLLKLHTNYQILVSPQYGRWVAVPQGKTFIAYEVLQILQICIMQIGGAFGRIYHTLVGLNVSFSMAIHFQNAHKMRDFQYPLIAENGMMYHKERHPLLMKCFKTFIRCMRQVKEAHASIRTSFMGLDMPFLTPVDSQIGHK